MVDTSNEAVKAKVAALRLVADAIKAPPYVATQTVLEAADLIERLASDLRQAKERIAAVKALCDEYEEIWAEAGIGDSGGIEIYEVRAALAAAKDPTENSARTVPGALDS